MRYRYEVDVTVKEEVEYSIKEVTKLKERDRVIPFLALDGNEHMLGFRFSNWIPDQEDTIRLGRHICDVDLGLGEVSVVDKKKKEEAFKLGKFSNVGGEVNTSQDVIANGVRESLLNSKVLNRRNAKRHQ